MNAIIDNIETEAKKVEIDIKEAWAWLYDNIHKLDKTAVDRFQELFGRKRAVPESRESLPLSVKSSGIEGVA